MRVWSHGFNERVQIQVAGPAQESFAGANMSASASGVKVLAQPGAAERAEDERLDGFGSQARLEDRAGDAGADFLVDSQHG